MTPPTMSECPFKYFVAEWITMSKPDSIGRWIQGVAKVLSETLMIFFSRAIFAMASMSMIFSSGLLGVSIQTMRVLDLIDFSNFDASVRSTKVKSKLAERRRTFSKSQNVTR